MMNHIVTPPSYDWARADRIPSLARLTWLPEKGARASACPRAPDTNKYRPFAGFG
jgi:hypothetical protein